jgi:hypothetical protein
MAQKRRGIFNREICETREKDGLTTDKQGFNNILKPKFIAACVLLL